MLILSHMDKLYLALSFQPLYNTEFPPHLETFTLVGEHVISVTSNELIQDHCGCSTNQCWSSIISSTYYSGLGIGYFSQFSYQFDYGRQFHTAFGTLFFTKILCMSRTQFYFVNGIHPKN